MRDRAVAVTPADLQTEQLVAAGKLAVDLADLRFADQEGRLLHSWSDGDVIWVRIPELSGGGVAYIDAWTGNSDARSVLDDPAALAVEYGCRTHQTQGGTAASGARMASQIHPVTMPDGTLALVAGTTAPYGLHAKYSQDGGHTWSVPEPFLAPSDPTRGRDMPGGFLVDPVTGRLTAVFYSLGVSSGLDWTDPEQHLCQLWVAQADDWDNGRPVFGTPRPLPLVNRWTGQEVAWAITYTNPIRTSAGSYVVVAPHAYHVDGRFGIAVLRSTDAGATWQQSAVTLTIPAAGGESGISESTIAERPDGSLVILSRQQQDAKYHLAMSVSTDDGITWSPMTDSNVLASNTQSNWMPHGDLDLLGWAGHNAYGQKSYRRNNFTLAWSDDGGTSFHGYHDMTAATRLSTPGWVDRTEERRMVETFIVEAGQDSLLMATAANPSFTILVEDLDRYLRGSHGAVDRLGLHDPSRIGSGCELAESRWWRTSPSGELSLVSAPRTGRQAVRLTSSQPGTVAMSRIVPGARVGRMSFDLRRADDGATTRIAVQEALAGPDYPNVGSNARGTVAIFEIAPDGEIGVATSTDYDAEPMVGWNRDDPDPAVGSLDIRRGIGAVAFDYEYRTIGLDLIRPREIEAVVLIGTEEFAPDGTTRITPDDLDLWTSDTNNADWVKVKGWTADVDGLTITISGPALTTRYVKVSQHLNDHDFDFANDLEEMIHVLPERPDLEHPQQYVAVDQPTSLPAGEWQSWEIDWDLDAGTVELKVDDQLVCHRAVLHEAPVVTHLGVAADATSTLSLDLANFRMQDRALGLPTIMRVGRSGVPR